MAYCTHCSSTVSGTPCTSLSQASSCRKKSSDDSDFSITKSANDFVVSSYDSSSDSNSSCSDSGGGCGGD